MAGNFGGGENIFFTDDSNIVLIDPNAIIDANGQKKDRVIKQENLVMYANLEVSSVPRTKLAVGQSVDSGINNTTIASINFLKPQGKNTFDTSYTEQYTGGRNAQGTINQISFNNSNPQQNNYVDTQLLGMKSINVDIKFNGIPEVSMQLVDVQGKALFETGGNSPYSVFMYYPYPVFYLTLKGFYGKAIKYELMLRNFNASFETSSGNYNIDLKFIARTSAILDDIRLGYLFALPSMYPIYETTSPATPETSSNATASLQQIGTAVNQNLTTTLTSKGYSKLKQVFQKYKDLGLIDQNVPTLSLNEMVINLSKYTQFLNDEFQKLDFTSLTALQRYQRSLDSYKSDIVKWRNDFIESDQKNVIVLNTDGSTLLPLKNVTPVSSETDQGTKDSNKTLFNKANDELTKVQTKYKTQLSSVPTWGEQITTPENFYQLPIFQKKFTVNEIDFPKTYKAQRGVEVTNLIDNDYLEFVKATTESLEKKGVINSKYQKEFNTNEPNPYYYTFNIFDEGVINVTSVVNQKNQEETEKLSQELQNRVKSNTNVTNLPFRPTIRNVMGVIIASVDAFYKLLDDIHDQAWFQRDNPDRLRSIIGTNAPSQEGKDAVSTTTKNLSNVIYPWPQFVQKNESGGASEYQVTYPGSKSVLGFTKGYDSTVWPEVEFVEQFLYGLTVKDLNYDSKTQVSPSIALKYTPSSAIEFVYKDAIYSNPESTKFIYEMYERILLNTFYSGLYYTDTNSDLIYYGSDMEVSNVSKSNVQGELINIIKNELTTKTLWDYLQTTSANEIGPLWIDFKNQIFVTDYVKTKIDISTEMYSESQYRKFSKNPIKLNSQKNLIEYLSADTSSTTSIMDTYPFSIQSFQNTKMVKPGGINFYNTVNTYNLDETNLFITNKQNQVQPYTKLSSTQTAFPADENVSNSTINTFYSTRHNSGKQRLLTEGVLQSNSSVRLTQFQTTSMLNSPYFLNSLMKAANDTGDTKYTAAAYLLLNSLPLSTFYERYLDTKNDKYDEYMFASFNKFSAVHKVPYAWMLKMGSVWHRYKKYIETYDPKTNKGVDILDGVWEDFKYKEAYDPETKNEKRTYQIIKDGQSVKTPYTLDATDAINTGFYPGLYNSIFKILSSGQNLFNNDVDSKSNEFWSQNLKITNNVSSVTTALSGPINAHFSTFFITDQYADYFGVENKSKSILMPSAGFLPFNQTYYETTTGDTTGNVDRTKVNVPSMYNGSARIFWEAPNYGWFNTGNYKKPNYDEYPKIIRNQGEVSEQFEFYLGNITYAKIEDLFGVFDFDELNLFENEFLNFCREEAVSQLFLDGDSSNQFYSSFKEILKRLLIIEVSDQNKVVDISKKQTNNLTSVLSYFIDLNVYLKIGNPKKFDRINFGYFISAGTSTELSKMVPQLPKPYGDYVQNSLPGKNQTVTLEQSKAQNPEAWKALELYLGFSTIDGISYGNTSYIYDFFIENNIKFSEQNVSSLHKLIKIYATEKKKNNGDYNSTRFSQDITSLMQNVYTKRTNIENQLRGRLPSTLGNAVDPQNVIVPKFDGDATKLEMWELFKALNDKWVAGIDFKQKFIFEEFLFFDRANRDIGDEFIINVETIRNYCTWSNSNVSVMSLIRQLLSENKMNFFVMPAYINFYGKPSKFSTSRTETILNNANDVFSAFGYVDTIASSPKFLCQYIGRPSNTLSMDNDSKYPFKSDSFDMGVSAGNPIRNTNTNVNQYTNNKAVGFVVDFGVSNQNVFKSFEITQNQNVTSSEQIQTIVDMGQLGGNKKTSQQTFSLFEFYKNRTYDCTLKTIGNVMLQPTMYFVVRHMPMFNGTYIIRSVNHSIQAGSFNTTIQGQRLSSLSNAAINNPLAALNEDFTKKTENQIRQFVDNNTVVTLNSRTNEYFSDPQQAKDFVISGRTPYQGGIFDATDSITQTCNVNLWGYDTSAQSKLIGQEYSERNITYQNLIQELKKVPDKKMRLFLYSLFYLTGYNPSDKVYKIKLNNLYGATGDIYWNSILDVSGYRCMLTSAKSPIPFLTFESIEKSINFTSTYFTNYVKKYTEDKATFTCLTTQNINWDSLDLTKDTTRICLSYIFTKLFYDYWYTANNSETKVEQNAEFQNWQNKVRQALLQASTKGLI